MSGKYSRQELFAPIGEDGQIRIRGASVFILGAGALGSSGAEMLVRAGVGRITIVDRDIIEWTNYTANNFTQNKTSSISCRKPWRRKKRLTAINSDVDVTGIVVDVTSENILNLIGGHDFLGERIISKSGFSPTMRR